MGDELAKITDKEGELLRKGIIICLKKLHKTNKSDD